MILIDSETISAPEGSEVARWLLLILVLALIGAVAFRRPALIAVAAAPLGWLALAARRPEPDSATVQIAHAGRSIEHDPVEVRISVELDSAVELLRVTFAAATGFQPDAPRETVVAGTDRASMTASVTAQRWAAGPSAPRVSRCGQDAGCAARRPSCRRRPSSRCSPVPLRWTTCPSAPRAMTEWAIIRLRCRVRCRVPRDQAVRGR
ncbi:MAG: hypothetical protein ACRDQ1_02900 [Sciscionella sp.]